MPAREFGSPCNRPGCPGVIDELGFCTVCDRRPRDLTREVSTTGQERVIAGFLRLPVLKFPDPTTRFVERFEILESERFCSSCGCEVGRGYAGQAPLLDGYCWNDRVPFWFHPPELTEDMVVDDRYLVVGRLARGGFGYVYLAEDIHLEIHVALKREINARDPAALARHQAEKEFLIALDHPHVVRITNFVVHRESGSGEMTSYIVMEFLNGLTLADLPAQLLTFEWVLGYGAEILAALEYLHSRGLIHCDLKPDNILCCADRLKLIDMGGARYVTDQETPIVGNPAFLPPLHEQVSPGPSIEADLYAAGKTLGVLYHRMRLWAAAEPSEDDSAAPDKEFRHLVDMSFRYLVERAAHPDRLRRFRSAAEMTEQLLGVARESVTVGARVELPERSVIFDATAELLDAGAGEVPPLELWTSEAEWPVLEFRAPTSAEAALALPAPRVAPGDPAARFLQAAPEPATITRTAELPELRSSAELQFAACRAHLALSNRPGSEEAAAELDSARECLVAAIESLVGTQTLAGASEALHRAEPKLEATMSALRQAVTKLETTLEEQRNEARRPAMAHQELGVSLDDPPEDWQLWSVVELLERWALPDTKVLHNLRFVPAVARLSGSDELRAARRQLEADGFQPVWALLDRLAGLDWRVAWYEGLLALSHGEVDAAKDAFERVYRAVPGETAPKLALGFCAELTAAASPGADSGRCHYDQAERYYQVVWWRDRSLGSAAFGLARVRLSRGDRAGAVAVLDEVPRISRHYDPARVAAVRALLMAAGEALPSDADLVTAVERLAELNLDDGARDRLEAAVREVAWQRLVSPRAAVVEPRHLTAPTRDNLRRVLGEPCRERGLRKLLESSYRQLATQARQEAHYQRLIDRANTIRPRTLR